MEDWDFWLHLLSKGEWGHTLPELLFWYRVSPRDRWKSINDPVKFQAYKDKIRIKYAAMFELYDNKHVEIAPVQKLRQDFPETGLIPSQPPAFNLLARPTDRLRLLFITHFTVLGGGELFSLRVVKVCKTLRSVQPTHHSTQQALR